MRSLILWAVMLGAALPARAAESAPAVDSSGFEALDASAAINLARGMSHETFGPMLHETEETAHSNEPILPLKVTVSVTKPQDGCADSVEARCKTSVAYVETENTDAPQLGFRTGPAFGWTVLSVDEYPKGRPPDCILIRLREEIRDRGRGATGRWPTEETAACVTDIGQEHTAEFNGDITPLADAERAVARGAPVALSKAPDGPWAAGFVTGATRSKTCSNNSAIAACKSFVVGLVSDGSGKDFAFRSPAGFAMKVLNAKLVFNGDKAPRCVEITFEEQLRQESKVGANGTWPTRKISTCVSPEGFAAAK